MHLPVVRAMMGRFCSACRSTVLDVTDRRGAGLVVDAEPTRSGTVALHRSGAAVVAEQLTGPRRDALRAAGRGLYQLHSINCSGGSKTGRTK